MAGLFLFPRPTRAVVGVMEIDASISENHEASAKLSSSPIEDGSSINDNIVLEPLKLTINGVVSKTPLAGAGLAGSASTFLASRGVALTGVTGIGGSIALASIASIGGLVAADIFGDIDGAKSRGPRDVYTYLLELRKNRVPFTVQTALLVYDDMVLTSLSAPRSSTRVHALEFTATFEQVKIVRATTVFPTIAPGPVADAATKTVNTGKQGVPAAEAPNTDSGLYRIAAKLRAVPQ